MTPLQFMRSSLSALALLLALVSGGCTTPVVLESGAKDLDLTAFPEGTEAVEVAASDGTMLRGVHVSAGPAAPLVLHFLPGRVSVTSGTDGYAGFTETLLALKDLGFSSLALDYRGVGASGGPIDAAALPEDALAMWREALSRAGEAPNRILIRSGSLGTLPLCALIAKQAQPLGIVVAAPIDSDSITTRVLDYAVGPILGGLLDVFYLEPEVPYFADTLGMISCPTLILLPSANPFFEPAEAEAAVAAVAENPRFEIVRSERDYIDLLLRFYGFDQSLEAGRAVSSLLPEEERFLLRLNAGIE